MATVTKLKHFTSTRLAKGILNNTRAHVCVYVCKRVLSLRQFSRVEPRLILPNYTSFGFVPYLITSKIVTLHLFAFTEPALYYFIVGKT